MTTLVKERPLALPYRGLGKSVKCGSVSFSAAAFGNPYQYSLTLFQKPEDGERNADLALRIATALKSVDATRVYATRPATANAQIIDRQVLKYHIHMGHGVTIIRNHAKPADGTMLERGDASAMTAGGCPRIVLIRKNKMVDAHAGRDSLLDRSDVLRGVRAQGRRHQSVVDAMLAKLDVNSRQDAAEVYAYVFYAIEPRRFSHDTAHELHGVYNGKLPEYILRKWGHDGGAYSFERSLNTIYLDLPKLIKAQLKKRGVLDTQIDLLSAYAPDSLLHDTRGPNPTARNLVVISRHT